MVLAISAVVVSGVLFYYNQAKENREVEESIKQVQKIAATIQQLYSNGTATLNTGDATSNDVEAISAVSGINTTEVSGKKVLVSATGNYVKIRWIAANSQGKRTAVLFVYTNSASSCMSYATFNMGTLMSSKTRVAGKSGHIDQSDNSLQQPFYLTPSEASTQCKQAADTGEIIIKYAMQI
ncbi:major pilin structural unit bundlin [Escherichia coli]|nr:major pilin structural unit bundlin [Escherichia coli]